LGETLFAFSKFHDAEEAFRHAVELDSSSGSAQIALAKLYYVLGDRTNFEAAVLRAIRIAPDNYLACYYYGRYLFEQQGRIVEAGKYYEKSCALSPQFVEGLIAWGGILSREGHWAEASGLYERAQSIDPGSAQIYYLLSVAYRKLGRVERAQWALNEFNRHAKP
jgi:tetratricopeptide (TPR) repeat protein